MYQPLTIYLGLYSKAEIMLFVKIYRLLIKVSQLLIVFGL